VYNADLIFAETEYDWSSAPLTKETVSKCFRCQYNGWSLP